MCSYVNMSKKTSTDGALYVCYYVLRLIPENTCVYCGKRGVFTFTISPRSFEKRGKMKNILQQKKEMLKFVTHNLKFKIYNL